MELASNLLDMMTQNTFNMFFCMPDGVRPEVGAFKTLFKPLFVNFLSCINRPLGCWTQEGF